MRSLLFLLVTLFVSGQLLAEEPDLAAMKAKISTLVEEMGIAASPEEYEVIKKKYDDAVAAFRQAKTASNAASNQVTAYKTALNNCTAAYKDREYDQSASFARQAIELEADSKKAHYMLGISLKKLGQHNDALASLTNAAELGYEKANLEKGRLLAKEMRRIAEGIAIFDAMLAANPSNARAPYEKGLVLAGESRMSEAAKAFDAATKADPGYTKAWIELAKTYTEMKQCSKAVTAASKAIQDRSYRGIAMAWYYKSVAQNQCGKYADASSAAESCLKEVNRMRRNKSFIKGGAHFEIGNSLELRERYVEAIAAFRRASESSEWRKQSQYEIERIKRDQGM